MVWVVRPLSPDQNACAEASFLQHHSARKERSVVEHQNACAEASFLQPARRKHRDKGSSTSKRLCRGFVSATPRCQPGATRCPQIKTPVQRLRFCNISRARRDSTNSISYQNACAEASFLQRGSNVARCHGEGHQNACAGSTGSSYTQRAQCAEASEQWLLIELRRQWNPWHVESSPGARS